MALFTISPNMGLIVPTPGQDPGPNYASDNSNSLNIIDGHNHSPGHGVPINPNGININADLTMNSNNLTVVKTVNFVAQSVPLPGTTPNLGAIYVAGNELVYNDKVGNVVIITNNGSVNAGAGSITGLPSGTASASYSSGTGTFIWQSATSTPANLDAGSVTIREQVLNGKGVTLSAPTALAANYSLFFMPALPGSLSLLAVDSAGNLSATIPFPAGNTLSGTSITDHTITVAKLAVMATGTTVGVGGYALSGSCGGFSATLAAYVPVTNLSVTITTAGRPVKLGLTTPAISGPPATLVLGAGDVAATMRIAFYRGATQLIQGQYGTNGNIRLSSTDFNYIDLVPAGTYTYTLQAINENGTTQILDTALFAYEI